MVRVVGIDHLVISVGDFEKSKAFYVPLMEFLGFGVEAEYEGSMMGWANGKTLFWIAAADAEGKKHTYRKGDIGFHHYAFRLRNRADVFLDPDGMKIEGMRYGERHEQAARKRAAAKRKKAASRQAPVGKTRI